MKTTTLQKRSLSVAVLVVLGGAIAMASAAGGDAIGGVILAVFYVVAAIVLWRWSGRSSDVAAIMRSEGDERQRAIDRHAMAISAVAMGGFAIAGVIIQLARGEDATEYAWVCTVGGVAYAAAIGVLRTRA